MIHTKIHRNLATPDVIESIEFILTNTEGTIDQFKQILNRALNCWPECPPDFKELADMLFHGRVLQDYRDKKNEPFTRQDSRG